jgi:hypothetical protein
MNTVIYHDSIRRMLSARRANAMRAYNDCHKAFIDALTFKQYNTWSRTGKLASKSSKLACLLWRRELARGVHVKACDAYNQFMRAMPSVEVAS